MRVRSLLAAFVLLLVAAPASAIGLLVPTDPSLPPLRLVHHRVDIDVVERGATTKVVEEFDNPTDRALEATFLFPLPKGATVDELALWMNGVRTVGKVMERQQARQIYENIVRRARDPGLVEYVDSELVEIKVFPIPARGRQKIELRYSHLVDYSGGLYRLTYPMKTNQAAASTLEDFTMNVKISAKVALQNLYSPTHKMAVVRRGTTGLASMEKNAFSLADDLALYWTVDDADVGISVLSYKDGDEPGYFMLLASPNDAERNREIIGKRLAIVVDTSGSMEGEKMEATKKALDQILGKLGEDDLFSIVSFGGYAEAWKPTMVSASKSNIEAARAFVRHLEPLGGTNIDEALTTAFATATGSDKAPLMVVLLTDGRPTVGATDTAAILKAADAQRTAKNARLFVLGVGDDLNTILLDKLSSANGGSALYVKGNAGLSDEVASFYDRISHPVLADMALSVDGVDVYGEHPRALQDLFKGQQLVVLGRYRSPGHATVAVRGNTPKGARTFRSDVEFASGSTEHAFIPRLWAQRQVGMLLDEIRSKGESPGLVEEVTQLATRFGIVTPYTSYLVVEQNVAPIGDGPFPPPRPRPMPIPLPTTGTRGIDDRAMERDDEGGFGMLRGSAGAPASSAAPAAMADDKIEERAKKARESLKADGGATGVAAAKDIAKLKGADTSARKVATTSQRVLGRTFAYRDGFFVDEACGKKDRELRVQAFSDAFFAVLKQRPDLKPALMLGEQVKVHVGEGRTLVIAPDGQARIDDGTLRPFLAR